MHIMLFLSYVDGFYIVAALHYFRMNIDLKVFEAEDKLHHGA